MNYVKITAKSPFINVSLFVKESDCGKVLKGLQAMHMKNPVSVNDMYCPYKGWVNENFLSVKMKRVIIHGKAIASRLQPIIAQSLAKITA